ncbi:unnamed protein product [Pylaiella littoralis]
MPVDAERKDAFMTCLFRAHRWRYTLKVGVRVDARQQQTAATATATSTATVHFLGDESSQSNASIDQLSCDIQPLHTFTRPWRDHFKRGSIVEVRSALGGYTNSSSVDVYGGGGGGRWEKAIVVKLGRDIDNDEHDDIDNVIGDEDGAGGHGQQRREGRMVLVDSSSSSSSSVNTIQRWVNVNSEDVCQEGTHLTRMSTNTGQVSSASTYSPTSTAESPSTSSAEKGPHAATMLLLLMIMMLTGLLYS